MPSRSIQEGRGGGGGTGRLPGEGRKQVDFSDLLDMHESGLGMADMASEFGISIPTLSRRVGELGKMASSVIKYRAVQALELTALQARVLAAITEEKIETADLKDLVGAFKILKDKELVMDGKPSEIKGLIGLLIQLEKEDLEGRTEKLEEKVIDVAPEEDEEGMPKL